MTAALNQWSERPGGPGGHSPGAINGKHPSATPGPPGPPTILKDTHGARRTVRTAVKLATVLSLTLGAGLATGQPAFAYCPECSHPGQFHDIPEEQKPHTTDKVREGLGIATTVLSSGPLAEFGGVDGVGVGEGGGRGGGASNGQGCDGNGDERGGPSRTGGTRKEEPQRTQEQEAAARVPKPTTGTTTTEPEAGRPEQKFAEADRGPGYQIVTDGAAKVPEPGFELDFKTLDLNSQKSADCVSRIKTGRTKPAEDDPNDDSDGDDFDETYRGMLPKPCAAWCSAIRRTAVRKSGSWVSSAGSTHAST
ncbi:hypothetical protein ACFVYP_39565 [Kitasatospora sp. NPDC058201]|uniref:hypothetical protein n=1 Tax=unclassified Kitasatospora TaxID=2633591 RepID=UPI00365911D4